MVDKLPLLVVEPTHLNNMIVKLDHETPKFHHPKTVPKKLFFPAGEISHPTVIVHWKIQDLKGKPPTYLDVPENGFVRINA